jgi:hypothetical protein
LTERHRAALVLVAATLVAGWPLLLPWVYDTHDGHYAIYNAAQFHEAVRDGHLPVRWLPDLFGGRGIPHFVYYHPLAFYLVEAIRLVVPSTIASMKIFELLAIAAAGFTMREWLRGRLPAPAALAGAVAYVLAPYHLVEIHVKGDPPAMLAYAVAPLVPMAIERAARGTRFGPAALAVTSASLVLSHMLSALLLIPFLALWAALAIRSAPPRAAAARVAGGVAAGAMLSAWHWLPALAERHLVHIDSPLGILFFDWGEQFVAWWQWLSPLWGYHGSFAGTADDMSFQVGPVHLGAAVAAVLVLRRKRDALAVWSIATLVVALAMTHAASRALWEVLPFLRFVQYPWRFLSVVSLAASALLGWAVAQEGARRLVLFAAVTPLVLVATFAAWERNGLYAALALWTALAGIAAAVLWNRSDRSAASTSFALTLLLSAAALPWSAVPLHARLKGEPFAIPLRDSDLAPERVRLGIRRTTARDDYLPRTVDEIPPRDPEQEYLPPPGAAAPEPYETLSGDPVVETVSSRAHRRVLRVRASVPSSLALNLHEFPGWDVRIREGDDPSRVVSHAWDAEGRIVVSVPGGTREVEVVFTSTEPRRTGGWISVAGLLIVGLGAWIAQRTKEPSPARAASS